jgi:exosortase
MESLESYSDTDMRMTLPWRGFLIWSALIVGILTMLYWEIVWEMMLDWWTDPNYSHGFLVPVFSIYLVYRQRKDIMATPMCGAWLGLPLLLAGLCVLILGHLGAENFLMRSSLLITLAGLIMLHLGPVILHKLSFPLMYLVFMLPLPAIILNSVTFPLQGAAVGAADAAFYALGIPCFLEGNIIHLAGLSLGVTEACSGIRSLISLLALAVAWAYLVLEGWWSRFAVIVAAVIIAIAANSLRVIATGIIALRFGLEYAEGFYHSFSGWLVFLVASLCLFGLGGMVHYLRRTKGGDPGAGSTSL